MMRSKKRSQHEIFDINWTRPQSSRTSYILTIDGQRCRLIILFLSQPLLPNQVNVTGALKIVATHRSGQDRVNSEPHTQMIAVGQSKP